MPILHEKKKVSNFRSIQMAQRNESASSCSFFLLIHNFVINQCKNQDEDC
jgi:hypothetical protein